MADNGFGEEFQVIWEVSPPAASRNVASPCGVSKLLGAGKSGLAINHTGLLSPARPGR
jgi:hypothetical protein